MANGNYPPRVVTQPRHLVTKYKHLALYAVIGAVGCVVVAMVYANWMKSLQQPPTPQVNLQSGPAMQLPAEPEKKEPPPENKLVEWVQRSNTPQQQVAVAQENPDKKRWREERLKALKSPILVDFSQQGKSEPVQVASVGTSGGTAVSSSSNTMEIPSQFPLRNGNGQPHHQQVAARFNGGRDSYTLDTAVQGPRGRLQLIPGTTVEMRVAQPLNSDREGPFTAIVTSDVLDSTSGQYVLIPAGTLFNGWAAADTDTNEPYLHLSGRTFEFPNGKWLPLYDMPGADGMGGMGVRESVNRHYLRRYGRAAVLSLVTGAVALALYSNNQGYYNYSPADAAAFGLAQVLGRQVSEELRDGMRIPPTVLVPAGYTMRLFIDKGIGFDSPYPF